MIAVECRDVSFRYPSGRGVVGVTLQVRRGELVGIVGPNSAGKSTLLRLLSKVLVPQQGRILIQGQNLAELSRLTLARIVAVVPQEFQVAFPFTAAEVVMMGRFPHPGDSGRGSSRNRAVAWAAMQATGVADLADRRMDELSGGERQLVSIARALAQEPSVFLLDEPTAHLDLRHQRIVLEILLAQHRQSRRTTILVSHDLALAAEHCDRLVLLADGRIRAAGPPEEVITNRHLESAFGCPVDVERHPLSGRLHVRGRLPFPDGPARDDTTPRM